MKRQKFAQINRIGRLTTSIVVMLFSLFILSAADNSGTVNPMKDLSNGDQKKLTEADDLRSKADELVLKASGLYVDASNIRQREDFSPQSSEAKEVQKMEQEAMDDELDASSLYQKTNNTKYSIYKKYITDFHKNFKGSEAEISNAKQMEQIADDSFIKAAGLREEGSKAKDHWVTFSKYQEANETETNGIENLIAAYNAYKAWPKKSSGNSYTSYTETPSYESSTTTAGTVMYEESPSTTSGTTTNNSTSYNDPYASDYSSYTSGTTDYSTTSTPTEDYSSSSSSSTYETTPSATTSTYTSSTDYSTPASTTTVKPIEETPASTSSYSSGDYQSYSGTSGTYTSNTKSKSSTTTTQNYTPTYHANIGAGVVFAVQLSAVVAPLTPEQKQRVYDGPETLTEQIEGIWYKYQVIIGSDYEEAKRFRNNCGIKDAFIVAYRDGIKIKLREVIY